MLAFGENPSAPLQDVSSHSFKFVESSKGVPKLHARAFPTNMRNRAHRPAKRVRAKKKIVMRRKKEGVRKGDVSPGTEGVPEQVALEVSRNWLKHWDDRYQKYYYDHIDGKKTREE